MKKILSILLILSLSLTVCGPSNSKSEQNTGLHKFNKNGENSNNTVALNQAGQNTSNSQNSSDITPVNAEEDSSDGDVLLANIDLTNITTK
ncbi:hypothetical protein [Staphylococcus canis]|uniref:hypothetical protein n=1 Tax=Staphylococcus canis TaxID=2724942 RepID=UPI003D8132C1